MCDLMSAASDGMLALRYKTLSKRVLGVNEHVHVVFVLTNCDWRINCGLFDV